MRIAIVGLGLIGASFAKALKKNTTHELLGIDRNPAVIDTALSEGMIDRAIEPAGLSEAELTIVALYPEAVIEFLRDNISFFSKDSMIFDCCGIKEKVVSAVDEPLYRAGLRYVGVHPMAGREFSGIAYSTADLFENASFIMTPTDRTDTQAVEFISSLAETVGFSRAVITTAKEHDRIIAYTSQLAHLVSNAYIKSPTLQLETGFSAGSFRDLTRVAKCNPEMWTALFLDNKTALLYELDVIMGHLQEYRNAIACSDTDTLHSLLKDGNDLKEWSLRKDGEE